MGKGQELDSEEIDLTKPQVLEKRAVYLEFVKLMVEYIKVQLDLLHKIVVKKQGLAAKGTKLSGRMQKKLALQHFLKSVEKIEQRMEMEGVIKKAIDKFMKAEVSTPAQHRRAKEKLKKAVKATMEKLEAFDPKMKERQEARINTAMKEKKQA